MTANGILQAHLPDTK